MEQLKVAHSYVALEKAGVLLGVSVDELIHAGAFNQVQICVNVYARASGLGMQRIDVAINGDYADVDEKDREKARAHDKVFCEWIERLKCNTMPAGIYEVTQDDLRLLEMREATSIEIGEAFKSDERGLWEIEFDPIVEITRSDLVMLTTEIDRIQTGSGIEAKSIDKPMTIRERNTLLTIIAVLCKDAGYDYTKAAKTAGLIQSTAAGMGVSIGETTIENHLKKIPDALGARTR
jgi:hypothetical protein